jgi:hypothetical protein
MKKLEYKVVTMEVHGELSKENLEEFLNEESDQGWKLVTIDTVECDILKGQLAPTNPSPQEKLLVFAREI